MKHWMQDLVGAGLAVGTGLSVLASHPFGGPLADWSYDLPYKLRPELSTGEIGLVSRDPGIDVNIVPQPDTFDAYAAVLNRLVAQGARLVVFTEVFSERFGSDESRERFLQALRRARGRVVLAARAEAKGSVPVLRSVLPELASEAPSGFLATPGGAKSIVRRLDPEHGNHSTLAVVAAQLLGRSWTNTPASMSRWMNYYGNDLRISQVGASEVLAGKEARGLFKGKIVLVDLSRDREELATPYTFWTRRLATRSEIEATAILNLTRREWLWRLPSLAEVGLLGIVGVFLGFAFMGLRPVTAALLAVGMVALSGTAACLLFTYTRVWFPWLIVAVVQVPVALAWGLLCYLADRPKIPHATASPVSPAASGPKSGHARTETLRPSQPTPDAAELPRIPDHTLVKCIGRGAYGEVWLARDIFGHHQAVKIVKARNFPEPAPYEREFKGIERFAPISRSHPGLVQVLHVGRSDADGYFFYIMELADDAVGKVPRRENTSPRSPHERQRLEARSPGTETRFDPLTYSPRTLASELTKRGHFSTRESVEIGLRLTSALQHLHERKLVHRDIKPSNIIFVEGAPKFADIGLVAPFGLGGAEMTRLGTEGYLAPEGPGAPAADIYSLGKVFYEISMGRDRWQFPELPTTIGTRPDQGELRRLHAVILTACETEPAHRFKSAAEMHSALKSLSGP